MRTSAKRLLPALALVAVMAVPRAKAADIDLFSGTPVSGVNPNLLIVLDNSGAWNASVNFTCPSTVMTLPPGNLNTAGGFEQCSLYSVLQTIATNTNLVGNLNMGLMLFGQGSTNGSVFQYPALANPGPLPVMDTTNIAAFQSVIAALAVGGSPNNTSNGAAVGASMQEAWAFYGAKTGFSGTTYSSPITSPCQKNFVIYIANANNMGKPQDNTDTTVFNTLACSAGSAGPTGASCGGATTAQQAQIALNPSYNKYQANWGDEWARFNYQTDIAGSSTNQQNIITYTIAVTDGSNPDYVEDLRSMAANGGGKMFVVTLGDMNGLMQAILKILNEVQAVNSVFASASLPVSTNAQGTFQNQVFMGMFRPDPQGNPRWMGNLKQYQFGVDTSSGSIQLFLADATGAHALSSSGTGFLSPNAISFWTSKDTSVLPDSNGGFWLNDVQGVGGGYDSPDGEVVEKGGVGQQIRLANLVDDYTNNPTSPRNVYTYCPANTSCSSQLSSAANAFATTNSTITGTMLGATGASTAITSITRSDATGTATVTLASAPSLPLTAGQTATITGSLNGYNGTYTIGSVLSPTQFTIAVNVTPPTPATGSYIASVPAATLAVSSLTRSSASSTTAVATTSTAHGLSVGQKVTISGGTTGTYSSNPLYSAYYGTFTVASVPTTTSFTYTVTEGPATPLAITGTAVVGTTSYAFSNIQRTASTYRTTAPASGNDCTAGTWCSTATFTGTTAIPPSFTAGSTVTISGTNTVYDGAWKILSASAAGSGACPNASKSGSSSLSFCYILQTTPNMPDPAPTTNATPVSGSVLVSSLTRSASNCSTSNAATATVSTGTTAHGFSVGQTINMGGTPGVNENAYVGNVTVQSVPTTTSFTYSVNTRPLCSDTSSGMIATTSAGGIAVTRDTLMRWARGEDNAGDEPSPGSPINIRPSVHGDVVHARPTVVNYGGSIGVVVFYGAGDGTFRAINGNQPGATPASIGSTPPGGELWSFIAPEFYGKLKRLHDNSPAIQYFSTPPGIIPTPLPKDYFFDGIAGLYQNFNTGKVYIYLSARRGGNVIYALDVSDPTNPLFMWRHTNADSGFSELGQTWSQPKVALVKGYVNPVLIFGAGYDSNEDSEPPIADTMGRGIFILDAVTGAIVWQAGPGGSANSCSGTPCLLQGMTYAIPADVTLMDNNGDGFVDRAYAADLGGNIWRIDFEPASGNTPASWQVNLFAALGGASTDATKRKFFFPPDAVATSKFTAVMDVTGDREHPLYAMQATSIVNRFYMLKDTKTGLDASGMVPIVDDTSDTGDTSPISLFNATTTAYDGSLSGFYVTLTNAGEKGVNAPLTVGGFTYFGTNTPIAPSPTACDANLGTARSYQIGFLNGTVVFNVLQGGGLPPSPVAGLVNVNIGGQTVPVPFIIGGSSQGCAGADCQSSIGAQKANIPIKQTRSRAYWYRNVDQ